FHAKLRRTPGRPRDAQRLCPTTAPRRERQQIREVVVVVNVEMGDEDVVDVRYRHAHRENVFDAAGAKVEEETIAVAELNHDARTGLIAPRRIRTAADKRDAHLVRPNNLRAGEVVVPALNAGCWAIIRGELEARADASAVRALDHI